MVRSFFNPAWKDLGLLATYGRWLGTNWVWAEWLSIYHAIFSITIPIFLVELTYPQSKTRIWLSTRMRVLFHGLLVLAIILGFFAFPCDPGRSSCNSPGNRLLFNLGLKCQNQQNLAQDS